MKHIILLLAVICSMVIASAQEKVDSLMIGFKVVILPSSAPDNVVSYFEGRVTDMLTSRGIALTDGNYVLEVSINEIDKSLIVTTPPRIKMNLEIVIKAIDRSQDTILNTIILTSTGMDTTESKAFMGAIRGVNLKSRNFLNFIEVSKQKLYDYYKTLNAVQTTEEIKMEDSSINQEQKEVSVN